MWMACYTQEEIGEKENITKETVSQVCQIMANLQKSDKAYAEHATDFQIPLYNVWKLKQKQTELTHHGLRVAHGHGNSRDQRPKLDFGQ